jgi:F-box protein 9
VTAPAPTAAADADTENLSTAELIASFAHLPIPQAEPLVENTPPLPCPIAKVPSEVLIEILRHVAVRDPATFGRMALVCKQFAYHFVHQQSIWKHLCQQPEFGFEGMHYAFSCDTLGQPIYTLSGERYTPFPEGAPLEIPKPLSSWSQVFQSYPRIRFTGIYISTVNYMRPGAASVFQTTSWNSPIHIVTYYRYLRFYPDGSVVSLLTTTEPVDVVPHISKENMMAARAIKKGGHHLRASEISKAQPGTADYVPPVAMEALKYCLRGRWRLTPPVPLEDGFEEAEFPLRPGQKPTSTDPRDLVIETEGPASHYIYMMRMSLRSPTPSKSHVNPSKNTKLVWQGFWSYNTITDDIGEFSHRNDRAFVFRRVRGWGLR